MSTAVAASFTPLQIVARTTASHALALTGLLLISTQKLIQHASSGRVYRPRAYVS